VPAGSRNVNTPTANRVCSAMLSKTPCALSGGTPLSTRKLRAAIAPSISKRAGRDRGRLGRCRAALSTGT
jgi:hypothetical protein